MTKHGQGTEVGDPLWVLALQPRLHATRLSMPAVPLEMCSHLLVYQNRRQGFFLHLQNIHILPVPLSRPGNVTMLPTFPPVLLLPRVPAADSFGNALRPCTSVQLSTVPQLCLGRLNLAVFEAP